MTFYSEQCLELYEQLPKNADEGNTLHMTLLVMGCSNGDWSDL